MPGPTEEQVVPNQESFALPSPGRKQDWISAGSSVGDAHRTGPCRGYRAPMIYTIRTHLPVPDGRRRVHRTLAQVYRAADAAVVSLALVQFAAFREAAICAPGAVNRRRSRLPPWSWRSFVSGQGWVRQWWLAFRPTMPLVTLMASVICAFLTAGRSVEIGDGSLPCRRGVVPFATADARAPRSAPGRSQRRGQPVRSRGAQMELLSSHPLRSVELGPEWCRGRSRAL